ncbi:unnamed protein product [Urochloa humidicola]
MSCSSFNLFLVGGVAAVASVAVLEAAPAVDEAVVLAAAHALARLPARTRAGLEEYAAVQIIRFSNLHHLHNCMHDREPMVRIVRKKNDNLVLFVSIA